MVIVWTAHFSGVCIFVIELLFSMHGLRDKIGPCATQMHQGGWGSGDGAANQVSKDRMKIHVNSSTATLYQPLPLASLVGGCFGEGSSK